MTDARQAAASALRLAAAGVTTADALVTGPFAWILNAAGGILTHSADLVAAGPGWTGAHRSAMADLVADALGAIPGVRSRDAVRAGDGFVSGINIVRVVSGLSR